MLICDCFKFDNYLRMALETVCSCVLVSNLKICVWPLRRHASDISDRELLDLERRVGNSH